MDSTDKLDKFEKPSGKDLYEQESEKINTDSNLDILAGDLFQGSGKIDTGSVPAPEISTENEKAVTGSQVDIVTGDVFENSSGQENKPDSGTGGLSGARLKKQGDDEDKQADTTHENHGVRLGRKRLKGRLSLLLGVVVSLFLGIGYIYIKYDIFKSNNKKLGLRPERSVIPISKGELIAFDSFIVPFSESKEFTYISLSIVIRLPNKELRNEINGKRDRIRGILYDMFLVEINRENRIPPIDHLKKLIIETVNGVISGGVVKEVFFTQFLAV